eukprot:5379117-Ditylum_brightwellii.AAC.1
MVRHRWPSGSRFLFHCYQHWAILVIKRPGMEAILLHSKEGVTQGDPTSMIGYGVTLVPLAEQAAWLEEKAIIPFYADDECIDGPACCNARIVKFLVEKGPDRGYFPEPEKSILVCDASDQLEETWQVFAKEGLRLRFQAGYRYVGGFIGTEETRKEWVEPQVQKWVEAVETLATFALMYPQTAYA